MLEEAEFYNITELIKLVKEKIKERDAKQNQVTKILEMYKYQVSELWQGTCANYVIVKDDSWATVVMF